MGCSCRTLPEEPPYLMSPQADMYRQKAAEAKNRAAQATNPHVKSALKKWRVPG
jgi:hypothetical protein